MNALLPIAAALFPWTPSTQESALELEAFWEPCAESRYGLFERNEVLREAAVAEPRKAYGAADFMPFLPPQGSELGQAWSVDPEAAIVFLRQFHPGARARLHHGFGGAQGTYALLRAENEDYLEVLIRAHAEFELAERVTFTPAQYEGRLIVERATKRPVFFRFALPDRNTNVDVNAPMIFRRTPDAPLEETTAADIGYVPRMELVGGEAPEIQWTRSVPDDEARLTLARSFYAFAAIEWLPFEEAVLAARERERPLHVVVLFGTLDDESC